MVFYQRFEQYLKPREIFVEDSLSEVSRKLDLAKKKADSIDLAERTKGYYFVDVPYLSLLEQPSAKSKVIGIFWPYTYVKKLQEKEVNGYVKVKIDDHVGFVFSSFLVDRIDKVTVASPNKEAAYKGYFTSLMESTTVQSTIPSTAPSNHGTQSSELKSSSSLRTYYRGPKGGCYYFSSSGKKVYVDKSHCN
jgi:hypothetical protein